MKRETVTPYQAPPISDDQLDALLRRQLSHRDAPHQFTLGVMAQVRAQAAPAPLRLIKPDWVRWGKALLSTGALLLLFTIASPLLTQQLPAASPGNGVGVQAVQHSVENAFYDFADALMRPTLRLSEFLLGGIQIAP